MRPPTPQILDFGGRFWILGVLDFGSWGFRIWDFGDFGFWILGILDFGAEIQNPQSKIQTFLADFGDFGFWTVMQQLFMWPQISGILDFGDFGFGDFGFWILDLGDFGFWILDLGDFGFWGFWILDRYVANLYVRPPTPQIWGILDCGDFGFWGFWILDFAVWILDFGFCDKFWMLHKKRRLCTPNRVGGFF